MSQDGKNESCKILASVAALYQNENGLIEWKAIEKVIEGEGLDLERDPRLQKIMSNLLKVRPTQCKDDIRLSLYEFKQVLENEDDLMTQALLKSLVIRGFRDFASHVKMLYENAHECTSGEVKGRGELYRVTGNEWNISIYSIDGQKISLGEKVAFTLDEICGPLIHGLALDLFGEETVNGLQQEAPSNAPGSQSSETGGTQINWFLKDLAMILMCSLIKSNKIEKWTGAMKHDYVLSYFKGLCGENLQFSNATYSEAKNSDFKCISLAHFLKAFTKSKSLIPHIDDGLDLLFQLKSMEVTTDSLAMIGAVLANGGVSPFNRQEILTYKAVSGLLNAMYIGGMGKSSSMFAVEGGVPGICTESGAMLIVIPGVLGMGLYSPKIECSCSVRAYNFATDLIKMYAFHPYCKLERQSFIPLSGKIKKAVTFETDPLWSIFSAVSNDDLEAVARYIDEGLDVAKIRDQNGLSLLHVAAANGHLGLVKTFFCKAPDLLFTKDPWCRKPLDYATMSNNFEVTEYLTKLEDLTRTSLIESAL